MMQTVNISLPKKSSTKIEEIIEEEGYASKSEFFRTLIRLYLQLVEKDKKTARPFFVPFKKRPLAKIKKGLKETGFYKKEFIKSVVAGLKKSSVYAG